MENTTENNKLIAEFMGWNVDDTNRYDTPHFITIDGEDESFLRPSEMLFHTDWNWLMPVVDKIESVDNGKITLIFQQKSCLIWDNNRGEELEYFDGSFKSETKIEAVYTAVVEFIKWYNLNQE